MPPANRSSHRTVLLVDDGDPSRLLTKWFLSNFGFSVDTARSAEEALALFHPEVHDIVVTDNSMPGISGLEMAHVMKLRSPATPILMYTGLTPRDATCVDAVLERPSHPLELKKAIEALLEVSPQ